MNETTVMKETSDMSQINLMQMADILSAPTPEPTIAIWAALAGLLVMFILFLLWRYLTQPLTQLQRRLKQGKLSYREAAHQLARLTTTQIELQQQIDQLRFQRQSPEPAELLSLIKKVKHGR